jgi:flagellar biosynthesis/type III secretory pathway protein FliH
MKYVTSVERMFIEQGVAQGWQEGLSQGLNQGLSQGLSQGRQQGQLELITRLLTRRFGALPDWARARLQAAHADQLEQWADRVLDAATLEAVFGGP